MCATAVFCPHRLIYCMDKTMTAFLNVHWFVFCLHPTFGRPISFWGLEAFNHIWLVGLFSCYQGSRSIMLLSSSSSVWLHEQIWWAQKPPSGLEVSGYVSDLVRLFPGQRTYQFRPGVKQTHKKYQDKAVVPSKKHKSRKKRKRELNSRVLSCGKKSNDIAK